MAKRNEESPKDTLSRKLSSMGSASAQNSGSGSSKTRSRRRSQKEAENRFARNWGPVARWTVAGIAGIGALVALYTCTPGKGSDAYGQGKEQETAQERIIDNSITNNITIDTLTLNPPTTPAEQREPRQSQAERIPEPAAEALNGNQDNSPALPDDLFPKDKEPLTSLDDFLERYDQGPIISDFSMYKNSTRIERENLRLTMEQMKDLIQFGERTVTFYDDHAPEYNKTLDEVVRGLRINLSEGPVYVFNTSYEGEAISDNFWLRPSEIRIYRERRDGSADEEVRLRKEHGELAGILIDDDGEENVRQYTDEGVTEYTFSYEQLEGALIRLQEDGYSNSIIISGDNTAMIVSTPSAYKPDEVGLQGNDGILIGRGNLARTIPYTGKGREDADLLPQRRGEPEEEDTHPGYRFDDDADRGGRSDFFSGNERDTMSARPNSPAGTIIGDQSSGSVGGDKNVGDQYERPVRPRN